MPSNQFQVRVQTTLDPPGLRLRSQATTASDTLAYESPGAVLTVLETEARPRGWLEHWTYVPFAGEDYRQSGRVTAWRVTLWDGDRLLSEQKSFLW